MPEIHRPGEILPLPKPVVITRKDILKAVVAWEENPPNKKYADILEATSDA